MKTLKQIMEAKPATKGEIGIIDPASEDSLSPKAVGEKRFKDKHKVKVTADANGNDDKLFKASNVKMGDRHPTNHGYNPGEDRTKYESVDMAKREDIVKGMKKNLKDFVGRYGKDAESVMYATATKMAKEDFDMFEGFEEGVRGKAQECFELLGEDNKQVFEQLSKEGQYELLTQIVTDVMGE